MDVNKGTKNIIVIMILIVVIGIVFSYFYYNDVNKNIDPRLIKIQKTLSYFDNINKLDSPFVALELMDKLEDDISSFDLYKNSYELGIVKNNKASVYIMMALYDDKYQNIKDSLFSEALAELYKSKYILIEWVNTINNNDRESFVKKYNADYNRNIKIYKGIDRDKLVNHRLEEIELTKIETPRRLSVVYSNIAVIKRHTGEMFNAVLYYEKAIKLWPKNHEAINNLRTLMGEDRIKKGAIDKLFPTKRD